MLRFIAKYNETDIQNNLLIEGKLKLHEKHCHISRRAERIQTSVERIDIRYVDR